VGNQGVGLYNFTKLAMPLVADNSCIAWVRNHDWARDRSQIRFVLLRMGNLRELRTALDLLGMDKETLFSLEILGVCFTWASEITLHACYHRIDFIYQGLSRLMNLGPTLGESTRACFAPSWWVAGVVLMMFMHVYKCIHRVVYIYWCVYWRRYAVTYMQMREERRLLWCAQTQNCIPFHPIKCLYVHTLVICMSTGGRVHMHTLSFTNKYIYKHFYACIYIYTYIITYIYIYVYVYVHVRISTHINIHT
jgi:hypothetical protein